MWITSMGNHGAAGVSENAGVLVVLVCDWKWIFYNIHSCCIYSWNGNVLKYFIRAISNIPLILYFSHIFAFNTVLEIISRTILFEKYANTFIWRSHFAINMAWLCASLFLSVHMQIRVCPNFSCMYTTYFTSLDLFYDNKGAPHPSIYSSYVAPWYIPLSQPLSLTPGGHIHLFTLHTIFKATSPMSHIASLVSSSNICVLCCIASSLYYLLEIKLLLLLFLLLLLLLLLD